MSTPHVHTHVQMVTAEWDRPCSDHTGYAVSPPQHSPQPPARPSASTHPYCNLPTGRWSLSYRYHWLLKAMWLPKSGLSGSAKRGTKTAFALGQNQRREGFKKKKKKRILLDSKTHNALGILISYSLMSTTSAGLKGDKHIPGLIWSDDRPITVKGSRFHL